MAEKEYIERDEAYKIINEAMTAGMVNIFSIQQRRANFEEVLEVIEEIPAADVQEVKHGKWITSEITMDSGCTSCSCCHSEYYIGDLQNLEGDNDFVMYCPHCGARMDGKEVEK